MTLLKNYRQVIAKCHIGPLKSKSVEHTKHGEKNMSVNKQKWQSGAVSCTLVKEDRCRKIKKSYGSEHKRQWPLSFLDRHPKMAVRYSGRNMNVISLHNKMRTKV